MNLRKLIFLSLVFVPCYVFSGNPSARLSYLFSDGAVLQQRSVVPIFGISDSREEVRVQVSWSHRVFKAHPDSSGRFVVHVRTPRAGGSHTISLNGEVVVRDVLLGEVWVCSGQSNMQFELSASDMTEVEGEHNPQVRIFTVPIRSAAIPQANLEGGQWHYGPVSDIQSKVSAVAYYFARNLQRELGVPVGILSASRGATSAEEWMAPTVYDTMDQRVKSCYLPPRDRFPGCWYNAMIAPLLPYRIAGFVWYQGENNTSRPGTYQSLLTGLIESWREDFGDKRLPFYIVELAPFAGDWSAFREIQQRVADAVPHCGFVSITDAGDLTNIHPKEKFPVGKRLADMAAANVYHKKTRSAPPRFKRAVSRDGRLWICLSHPGDSLVLKQGTEPQFFEVAGADGCFAPARARIDGKRVVLWSGDVPNPRYARYFYGRYDDPNLFSSDGYPVAPFRMVTPPRTLQPTPVPGEVSYDSSTMPGAMGRGWQPVGVNSATADVDLCDSGLRIRLTSGSYGYRRAVCPHRRDSSILSFTAAVKEGRLYVDYNRERSLRLYVEVAPDCLIDGMTGDTLVRSLDNRELADYMLRHVEDTALLYRNGRLIGKFGCRPAPSYCDDFNAGAINDRIYQCSSWSRCALMDRQSGETGLLEWRNGYTGLFSGRLRVKPDTRYRLELDAMISPQSVGRQMKGRLCSDKRDISSVLIGGTSCKPYVYEFRTDPEEYAVTLTLHNGYHEKQSTRLLIDRIELREIESPTFLQFGCFGGGASEVIVKSVALK